MELAQCWHNAGTAQRRWHEIHGSGPMGCDTDCWWPCPLWVPVMPSAFGAALSGWHRLRSVNEAISLWQGGGLDFAEVAWEHLPPGRN